MKKKKLFSLIAAVLAVFYCISTYLVFDGVQTNMITEFYDASENLRSLSFANMSENGGVEYAAHVITQIANYSFFPTAAILYDEDGNVISKSGNYIMICEPGKDNRFCFLDDYLTSDIMKQISDFYKKHQSVRTYRIDYCIKNGELVPVSIFIKGFEKGEEKTEKVVFSDEKAEFTFNGENENSDFALFESFMTRDWMVDESHYNYKYYKLLCEETFGKEVWERLSEKLYEGGGGYTTSDSFESREIFEVDGKLYKVYIRSGYRPIAGVVLSPSFKGLQTSVTIIFVLISAALFYAANKIYNRNRQLEKSRIAFTSAAAHELKTPIAIISNQCECILENVAPEKNTEYVRSVYSEALRMNKLVATLLQYNKLVSADSLKMEKTNVSVLAADELRKYESLFAEKKVNLCSAIAENIAVICNKELIALAVDNFLSNAAKYTPENGNVKLTVIKFEREVKVSVYNSGSGVSDENKAHIWEEFYREDKARERNDNSSGMGLAICKRIFDLHGFKHGFTNNNDGVEFWFVCKSR